MKKLIAIMVALAVTLLCMVSCGAKVTVDEIRAVLNDLLPRSASLNEIYFGEGLPFVNDEAEMDSFYDTFDSDIATINYEPVDPACGYTTEEEIKAETRAVFSEEYANFLIERAFVGLSATLPDGNGNQITESAVYARYLEQDGILTKRIGLKEEAIELGRTYDTSTAEIVKQKGNFILVDVLSQKAGEDDMTVRLKLVKTKDGWRLDSPTY